MRGKRVKQLRREFKERYGRAAEKSKWQPVAWVTTAAGVATSASRVTRNEERIFRDLYRKARKP